MVIDLCVCGFVDMVVFLLEVGGGNEIDVGFWFVVYQQLDDLCQGVVFEEDCMEIGDQWYVYLYFVGFFFEYFESVYIFCGFVYV